MKMRYRMGFVIYVIAAFSLGAMCGLALDNQLAAAQDRFGPEDVKHVPKTFVESADKSYGALKKILAELKDQGRTLKRIEQNTRRTATPSPSY